MPGIVEGSVVEYRNAWGELVTGVVVSEPMENEGRWVEAEDCTRHFLYPEEITEIA